MVKKKNKIFDKKLILLFLALVLLLISFLLIISSKKVVYQEIIPIEVKVGDKIGISTDNLNFGTLIAGQSATKSLNLENGFQEELTVRISLDGNISSFIYGENNFILASGESKEYKISLVLPNDTPKDFYEGNLIIEFLK